MRHLKIKPVQDRMVILTSSVCKDGGSVDTIHGTTESCTLDCNGVRLTLGVVNGRLTITPPKGLTIVDINKGGIPIGESPSGGIIMSRPSIREFIVVKE